ncbi:conserved membrane protein of unknown function [Microbacterium sp. Nx66]|uniref:hypothetical protein n=1 Tax=unclassified Microbacterium TaxID=2609290 RepID=UPI00165694F3|nr:hypothetical protein [Microbacterium sp. Nx66]CAD5142043.1 conserved membrane protein of unknown function [Microbacterium sp. Nx66]
MSDPQQPAHPSRDGAGDPAAVPTPPPLPAEPQYPGAQAPAPGAPYAPTPGGGHVFPTAAAPQAFPTATPQPYPTAPGSAPGSAQGVPPYGPPVPRTPGDSLGRAAFIVALVTLAIDVFLILARPFVYMSDRTYSMIGLIEGGSGILTFIGYGAALVLGLIAARRPGPRLLAGIAIGVSGAGLLTVVLSWLSSNFYGFL